MILAIKWRIGRERLIRMQRIKSVTVEGILIQRGTQGKASLFTSFYTLMKISHLTLIVDLLFIPFQLTDKRYAFIKVIS